MRKQKRRGLLLATLAIVLAMVTGLLFTSRIRALERQIGDMQQVIMVKQGIAPRTLITADMLETREIPRVFAHQSYLQNVAEVAEQRVAVTQLEPGAILRHNDVAPTSGLQDGARAISVGVNPISVQVDRVVSGSHVDVIVSYETVVLDQEGREVPTRRTVILLQDIEVVDVAGAPQTRTATAAAGEAAGQDSDGGPLGGIFGGGTDITAPRGSFGSPNSLRTSVVVATLKVTPADAQKLAYADTFASDIRLALRRSDDRAIEPFAPVTEEDFR